MAPVVFLIACCVFVVVALARLRRSRAQLQPLRERYALEPVMFSCTVHAQVRYSRWNALTDLKNGFGSVELRIYTTVLVVELAGRTQRLGRALGAEVVMETAFARMTRRRRGWSGTLLGARDRILITGEEPGRPFVQIAVAPGNNLEQTWSALERAGVRPEL